MNQGKNEETKNGMVGLGKARWVDGSGGRWLEFQG